MREYLFLAYLIIVSSSCLASAESGSVELNEFTFDKIVNKFEATLVKFDVAFPFGDKHDAFVALAKEAKGVNELLFAEVGVKDYGEKENEKLAKKYEATKENFPVVKLFLKTKKEPLTFDDTKGFTSDQLRRFIRDNSGIYLSLPGCVKSLDLLAMKFKNSNKDERVKVVEEAENVLDKLKNEEAATGKIYKTIMQKIIEKGDDFIAAEIARVNKLQSGKVTDAKKKELALRINILQSFTFSSNNIKEEL